MEIKILLEKYQKEHLPHAFSPFHYQAEAWSVMESFLDWTKTQDAEESISAMDAILTMTDDELAEEQRSLLIEIESAEIRLSKIENEIFLRANPECRIKIQ